MDSRSDTNAVVGWVRAQALPECTATVVGAWVWLRFPEKPAAEVRKLLSSVGFRWIAKREMWAHPCGKFSRGGKENPFDKYETQEITGG